MTNPNIFNLILVWPILNILIGIYQGVMAIHAPYALGFAIIILTLVVKLILYPLTKSQLQHAQKMQKVTPHLNKLKEKHKNDAKMLQQEQMKLFKEHGVNPAAGCLPLLIQFPIIIALYSVLRYVVGTKPTTLVTEINKILYIPGLKLHTAIDQHFFGLPLGKSPQDLLSLFGFGILLIPVVTVVLQFIQSKMMFVTTKKEASPSVGTKALAVKSEDKKEKKDDDFAAAMQTQTMYILPLFIGFSSFKFAIGLSLYWNTFTIFGIIQQYQIQGLGGLQEWVDKLKKK